MSETGLPTAVTVAIIGGAVSLLALALNNMISGWRDRATRQRQEFSKALAACVAYEEFPYVVRRRKSNAPQDERIRISSELSLIQRDIAYYSAWLATESIPVSKAYETLVAKLREIAGGKIREAWLTPPIDSDSAMNMPDLGLGALKPLKDIYLSEVACHLSLAPKPIRRILKKRRPV
ncbi:hypothetical protein DMTZ50_0509 [Dehalococcoides mccartyi]|nr:hypothetical protein [Dehalococcoides mccartyi]